MSHSPSAPATASGPAEPILASSDEDKTLPAPPQPDMTTLDTLPPEFAALFPQGFQTSEYPLQGPSLADMQDNLTDTGALHDQLLALIASSSTGAPLYPTDGSVNVFATHDSDVETDDELDEDMGEQSPLSATVESQPNLLVTAQPTPTTELQHAQIIAGATCVAVHSASVVLGRNPLKASAHADCGLVDFGAATGVSRHHATIDLGPRPPCIRVHGKHGLRLNSRSCQAGETISLEYGSVTTVQILNQCIEFHVPSNPQASGLQHAQPTDSMLDLMMMSTSGTDVEQQPSDPSSALSPDTARNLVQAAAAVGAGAPTRKRKGSPGSDASDLFGYGGSDDSDDGELGAADSARKFLEAAAAAASAASPASPAVPNAPGQSSSAAVEPVQRRMSHMGLQGLESGHGAMEHDLFQIFPASSTSTPVPASSPVTTPAPVDMSATTHTGARTIAVPPPTSDQAPQARSELEKTTTLETVPIQPSEEAKPPTPPATAPSEPDAGACLPPPPVAPELPSATQDTTPSTQPESISVPPPPEVIPEPPPAAVSATEQPTESAAALPQPPAVSSPPAPFYTPPPAFDAAPTPQPAPPQATEEEPKEKLPSSGPSEVTDLTTVSSSKTSPSTSNPTRSKRSDSTTSGSKAAAPLPPSASNPAALAYYHAIHGSSSSSSSPTPTPTPPNPYTPGALGIPPGFPSLGMPGMLPGMLPGMYPGATSPFVPPFSHGYPSMSPFGMVPPPLFPYPPPPPTNSAVGAHSSPTTERPAKKLPATRSSPATTKRNSRSPSAAPSSTNATGPPIRIIVGAAPAEADPAASLPGPIESLLDGPPIVHHGGALYLHPDVFGSLSAPEIESLEKAGIQEALQRLQSTLVVFLRARLKARRATTGSSTPGTPFGRSRSSKRHARTGADGSPAPSPAPSRPASPNRRATVSSRTSSPARSTPMRSSKPAAPTALANPPAVASPLVLNPTPAAAAPPAPTQSASDSKAEATSAPVGQAPNDVPTATAPDTAHPEPSEAAVPPPDPLALDFGEYDNLAFPEPPVLDA